MTEGPGHRDDSLRIHNTIPATSMCAEARKCGRGCGKARTDVGTQALGQGADTLSQIIFIGRMTALTRLHDTLHMLGGDTDAMTNTLAHRSLFLRSFATSSLPTTFPYVHTRQLPGQGRKTWEFSDAQAWN